MAVMGDYGSIYGFKAVGLDTFAVNNAEEAQHTLQQLVTSEYAVIYITEYIADQISPVIDKYKGQLLPCIVRIPGAFGNSGQGVENVKKFVETAVGSDILFSQK
jgi:V/A-type H+-transporting ATPase subunit F